MIRIISSCVEAENEAGKWESLSLLFSTSCTKTVALHGRRRTTNVKILNNHQNRVKEKPIICRKL